MQDTAKALRLHIGIFGRTNVGKSAYLNMIADQDVSITSHIPGTTTDVVEKVMEFHLLGPVVLLDTAGINDESFLGNLRELKTKKVFDRADCFVLIVEPNEWTSYEKEIVAEAKKRNAPLVVVINKIDLEKPKDSFLSLVREQAAKVIQCSSLNKSQRAKYAKELEESLMDLKKHDLLNTPELLGDLFPQGGSVLFIVPMDVEAPKGRILLVQVQAFRDCLDHDGNAIVLKENNYPKILDNLKHPPDLVVCDSAVVKLMVDNTPADIKCTTFSILMSRYKGDLLGQVQAITVIPTLKDGDKILIAEACSHHAVEDDIGRIKIPKMIKAFTGKNIIFEVSSGRDYPQDLNQYKMIIHCGGCMLTRNEMLRRISNAQVKTVPITNYGVCLSYLNGVLERVLSPFPDVLDFYLRLAKAKEVNNAFTTRC